MSAPFPEEFNRQVVSKIASFHFAPTELAKTNLINEKIPTETIYFITSEDEFLRGIIFFLSVIKTFPLKLYECGK